VAYYFSVKGSSYGETNNVVNTASTIVRPEPMTINGGFKIITEGDDNKFPYQLRQLIDDNNLTEGILTRQRGLQYGQGLAMYNIKFEQGKRIVDWFWDDTIGKELELWDYPEYIINVLMDIIFKREYYTMMIANRGARIGRDAKAVGLKHMPLADCRREWPDDRGRINNVFVADWRNGDPEIMERYPMFDPLKGINQTTSIHYEALYQPGRSQVDFVRPGYHGARKWMQRSNVAPDILKSQTDNGLNIKWHIISPQSYWDAKRTILIENCKQLNQFYKEEMLEELKDKILTGLSKVLSGIENVGKFFHSEAVQVELGVGRAEVMKWELIAIDMKVKDFTEAQIQISKRADSAITSGAGLAPSLANIIVDGKLASGSEKLYDYKLFIATETPVIGMKALKALNMWKRMRFPNIPGEFGLYHDIVKREEDLASAQRTTNNES
jgi:hypothetical protein